MEMKNFFKTAIFAGTLALGCVAAINFAPNAEAATYDYSNKVYQSYGQSDYGVANGFVYNINDLFDNYTNKERMTVGMDDPYGVYDIKIGRNVMIDYKDYIFNYNDPISAFVDIKHLSQEGDYLLFGNEYGYYAHTEKQEGRIVSTVLLFDVNYSKNDCYDGNNEVNINVGINVISQNAYLVAEYDSFKGDGLCVDDDQPILLKEKYKWTGFLTQDLDYNGYYLSDSFKRPNSGYIVLPIIDNKTNMPKTSTRLRLTDFWIYGSFESEAKKNSTDTNNLFRRLDASLYGQTAYNNEACKKVDDSNFKNSIRNEQDREDLKNIILTEAGFFPIINHVVDAYSVADAIYSGAKIIKRTFVKDNCTQYQLNDIGRKVIDVEPGYDFIYSLNKYAADSLGVKNAQLMLGRSGKVKVYKDNSQYDTVVRDYATFYMTCDKKYENDLKWKVAMGANPIIVNGNNNDISFSYPENLEIIKKNYNPSTSFYNDGDYKDNNSTNSINVPFDKFTFATYPVFNKPSYYSLQVDKSWSYYVKLSCAQYTPVTIKIWDDSSRKLVAIFNNTTEGILCIDLDSKKTYRVEILSSYRYYDYNDTNIKFLKTRIQKIIFNRVGC